MTKPLIFDATPLIYLTRASLSKSLKKVPGEKFTTTRVFNEVVLEGKKRGAPEASLLEGLFREGAIRVQNPRRKEYLKFVKEMAAGAERQPLHGAEAEVLCLANELGGIVVADDKVVRTVAKLLEIDMHGTAFVLGRLYLSKQIKKEGLLEKVREMRDLGWHVSAEDYLKITEYLKGL